MSPGGWRVTPAVWATALLSLHALAFGEAAKPRRLLMVAHSAGFEHQVVRRPAPDRLSFAEETVAELGRRGDFQTRFVHARREVTGAGPEIFDGVQAVLFFTTGNLPLPIGTREALFRFVRAGHGFIGVHSATDTWSDVAEYGTMLGGTFDGHPWDQRVRVIVEDAAHPATRPLGAALEIADEMYQFRGWSRRDVHVLLRLDPRSVDVAKGKRPDQDYALAWWRRHGEGRVFYTALGHHREVWADERFRRHLLEGIRWAMGMP
jgi:type 1 glutamine amidotransferase